MWLFFTCHEPGVVGETGGRFVPSAFVTGLLNVSVIVDVGRIWLPGAGVATAVAVAPDGNQLTNVGGEVSQLRICAETSIVPASAVRGSVI